jgi:tetratricopeptide (TPR) repeat protein
VADVKGRVCERVGLAAKGGVLAALLMLGLFIVPQIAAQPAEQDQAAKPAAKRAKAPKRVTATTRGKKLDPSKLDLLDLSVAQAMQVDPGKLDPKSANTWVVLGLLERTGGNLAGAKESQERAIAIGKRGNKAAAAAAAILLGNMHHLVVTFGRISAAAVVGLGGKPSLDLTDEIRREYYSAKASYEKAIALYQASGREDGMAAGYAHLGQLYLTTTDYGEAQAEISKALAINKRLQRKTEMAANYRALADSHRHDLDQAEVLLKEAVALDEAAGLKEGLAKDYEQLGDISKSRGQLFEAEKFYKEALSLTPRLRQRQLFRELAQLYRDRNDPALAAEMKEQEDAVDKESGASGRTLFNSDLGLYHNSVATRTQAEALEKLVPLEKKLGHWVGLATTYTLLGIHYAYRAESNEGGGSELEGRAEAMFREAMALNRTLGREPALAYTFRELIKVVGWRGKSAEVEAILEDARALLKSPNRKKDTAHLYLSLGHARNDRGDSAQACEYWRKGARAYPGEQDLVDALKIFKCADTR